MESNGTDSFDFHGITDSKSKVRFKNRSYGNARNIYRIDGHIFNGVSVCKTNQLLLEYADNKSIEIDYTCQNISDDASIIVLESIICQYLISKDTEGIIISFEKIPVKSIAGEMLR